MTIKQKELYNVIENLPEELSNKVIDYIEYLKFSYMTNKAPDSLIIKDASGQNKNQILMTMIMQLGENTDFTIKFE